MVDPGYDLLSDCVNGTVTGLGVDSASGELLITLRSGEVRRMPILERSRDKKN
jgi:hypothetical protein